MGYAPSHFETIVTRAMGDIRNHFFRLTKVEQRRKLTPETRRIHKAPQETYIGLLMHWR
jgi:hypothetical protein